MLPLVIRLQMVLDYIGPNPLAVINARSPIYFSALTNIQELTIRMLDFDDFTPRMELYFGHFAPKLRSLALHYLRGAYHDLVSFIGLFQNLDNFKLEYDRTDKQIQWHPPVSRSAPSM